MASNIPGYISVAPTTTVPGIVNASGFISGAATQLVEPLYITAESVSGGRAVAFNQSGSLQIAMASVSGRMPAVGVVRDGVLSGQQVEVWRNGSLFNNSSGTPFDFSGWMNQPLYVGASGHVIASGAPTASGNIQQMLGVSVSQSGMEIQLGDALEGVIAQSGDIGSGAIAGQAGGGFFTIASGTITTNDIGSGSIVSGLIASGQLGPNHFGSGVVLSGTIASGQLGNNHLGSGAIVRAAQFGTPIQSGTSWQLITEENVSGVRAVCISQSGNVRIAMAAVSGRMPAVGVVWDNVLSGINCNIYTDGFFQFPVGLFVVSGVTNFIGGPVWVGRSGFVCPISGSFNSGGYASGDIGQKLGGSVNSGAVLFRVNNTVWSGGPLGEATGGGIV